MLFICAITAILTCLWSVLKGWISPIASITLISFLLFIAIIIHTQTNDHTASEAPVLEVMPVMTNLSELKEEEKKSKRMKRKEKVDTISDQSTKTPSTTTSIVVNQQKKQPNLEDVSFQGTMQIIGIKNTRFLERLSANTRYKILKDGDFKIEVGHTGSLKRDYSAQPSIYAYSGGSLQIRVNEEVCCCGTVVKIPKTLPLGKNIKISNQILSDYIEKTLQDHETFITDAIKNCLYYSD